MKLALIYSTQHGRTRRVVNEVLKQLAVHPVVFELPANTSNLKLLDYDVLMFFAPTYGDEELEAVMEDYFQDLQCDLAGRRFVICELGNYYGYDDFSFGGLHIMRRRLLELNGQEFAPHLSLDSFPRLNWDHVRDWVLVLNRCLSLP